MLPLFVEPVSSDVSIGFVKNEYYEEAKVKVEFINESILFYYPCLSSSNCTSYHLTLPSGRYLLETWGASGGDCDSYQGGRGGFSSGELTLSKRTNIYVNIGGRGQYYGTQLVQPGGFNGGGNGWKVSYYGAGGGGATDIRINGKSLYNRVIVSGGGGGASQYFRGGHGGGLTGENGSFKINYIDTHNCYMSGATQTMEGISQHNNDECMLIDGRFAYPAGFGVGGSFFKTDGTGWASAGGGGGWFGGARGCVFSASGSGGSGYVFTDSSYKIDKYKLSDSYQLKNAKLIEGDSSEKPDDIWNEKHPNYGNGAARITLLDYYSSLLYRNDLTCLCKRRSNKLANLFSYIFISLK